MGLWLRSLLKEISVSNNTQLESNVGSNNTAVKRWACALGSILRAARKFPAQNFKGKRKAKLLSLGRDEKNRKVTRNL